MYHILLRPSRRTSPAHALPSHVLPAAIGELVFAPIIRAYSTLPRAHELLRPPRIRLTCAIFTRRFVSQWRHARRVRFI
eukprot:scaffold10770_cov33-Attheya_sp.AAC.3